ncbi:hypothetical protein [Halorubrum sp. DTA98]|uniref:hypothetical protein n=1 Tax=Halorubrum sp. DTA98 TaxID=3402163 RepID=UPI003AAC8AF0
MQRSVPGAVAWSLAVVRANPAVLGAFLLVGGVQVALDRGPADAATLAAVVGFLGVFLGRGYVGLVAADTLRRTRPTGSRLRLLARRLPAFLAAAAVVAAALVGLVVAVTSWVSPALNAFLSAGGFADAVTAANAALLVATTATVLAVLVKCCFLPEACFVGGYGPVEALRVTWSVTAVHRRKAFVLTAGLLALFAIGTLLDARIGGTARPVVLSVTLYETTVAVRSIGLTTAGPLRLLADASLSAVYYAVFAHQYVHALFDDR